MSVLPWVLLSPAFFFLDIFTVEDLCGLETTGSDYSLTKVKIKFALEQAMSSQRGSRGIALLILNLLTIWGWVVSAMPRPLYLRERDLLTVVEEAKWVPEPFWIGV